MRLCWSGTGGGNEWHDGLITAGLQKFSDLAFASTLRLACRMACARFFHMVITLD
jgi:hypothetical protein